MRVDIEYCLKRGKSLPEWTIINVCRQYDE